MFRHRIGFYRLTNLLICCLLISGQILFAQSTSPVLTNVLPASPNSASLGKFGEIPVGYYTGIADISVPLYEISSGTLKVPVSLSYHPGGVRVEEMASWAGMGWALNAGGVITRQVRGTADEGSGGYLYFYRDVYRYNSMSAEDQLAYCTGVSDYTKDSQPDLFSFNLGGESGQFYFDTTGQVVSIPNNKIKFEFGTLTNAGYAWKATDLNGTQYYFNEAEVTQTLPSGGSLPPTPQPSATTGWYLTAIVDALGKDTIQFQYTPSHTSFYTITSQTRYLAPGGANCTKTTDDNTAINNIDGVHLSRILFRNGSATFIPNTQPRCDYPGDTALSSIVVQSNEGGFYRKIQLYQRYVGSCDPGHPENSRLMLDSLTLSDPARPVERYSFAYNEVIGMPSRISYNQDHWGYYNGANNGTNFVPTSDLQAVASGGTVATGGADREVNPNYSQSLILQSITYPTGGSTGFQYENNTIGASYTSLGLSVGTRSVFFNPNYNPGGGGTPHDIDTTFTITDDWQRLGGVNGVITLNLGPGCDMVSSLSCPVVGISGPGGYLSGGNFLTGTETLFLPQGDYHVTVTIPQDVDVSSFFFGISWNYQTTTSSTQNNNTPVGGLRIKQVTDYNADNSTAKVKKYNYLVPDGANYSSGTLLSYPQYIGGVTIVETQLDGNGNATIHNTCPYTTISSGSNLPLIQTQSSYTGYRYVEELLGANGEFGKNVYEYTAPDEFPDRVVGNFPFPPSTSFEYKRGKLRHASSYRYNNGTSGYELVQEKRNGYADNAYPAITLGLKIGQNYFNTAPLAFATEIFSTESGWFPLVCDTTIVYDQNISGAYVQTIHHYGYSSRYYLPVADTTTNSKGQTTIKVTQYPLDFAGLTATDNFTLGIADLQNRNMVATPVEKYTILKGADGSNNVMAAFLTSYRANTSLVDTIWAPELSGNGTTSFTPAFVSSGRVVKSGLYLPQLVFPRYDQQGNIIEQQKIHNMSNSYLWDYLKMYPIAEVKNADSASIAYTSFEADGTGNWTIGSSSRDTTTGITGNRSYVLSGDISKSGLSSSGTYIVSYWTLNSSAFSITGTMSGYPIKGKTVSINNHSWTLYVHKVTGQTSVTISGSGHIDELRLYPATAQMTTYTYSPLIGMTSQCDVGNRITYYEYDGLARLKRIRDQDYNILKSLEYQYQASGGCGGNCFSIAMQTFAGTNTLSYPVGVFNVHGDLLDTASTPARYISLWNADTADAHLGTLAAGKDSLHFNITLNTGKTLPSGVRGCRYYQYDLSWNVLDAVRNVNSAYVDFGDGARMRLGATDVDTPKVLAPNTSVVYYHNIFNNMLFIEHSYADASLKTVTFYHNDATESASLDNFNVPATSLTKVTNFRGNIPQYTTGLGGSCYQQAGALTVANITNWNTIHTITLFAPNIGDGTNAWEHVSYAQDFMQNSPGLTGILEAGAYYGDNILDTAFKLSRLKTDWNTYFTKLQTLNIGEDHWHHEDLSALTALQEFTLVATNQNHSNSSASNPLMPLSAGEIDSVINQIAAGAGQTVSNGVINIGGGGTARTSASNTAVAALKAKGWTIAVNGVNQ